MDEVFQRHPDADERVRSALKVIESLLPLDIYPTMKRRFLSNCLWQITQAEGKTKYDLRYRSESSLSASRKEWRHEHVFRRKEMVDALLANPAAAEEIAAAAFGCVVTKSEHALLRGIDRTHREVNGWDRYRLAGIVVMDMATQPPHRHTLRSQ